MPLYPYLCGCGERFERVETMAGSHVAATCACGQMAARVWTSPYAAVDNTPAHYNNGLGIPVNSKRDIREAQRRYAGETGSSLIELGTDTAWRATPVRHRYPTACELGVGT